MSILEKELEHKVVQWVQRNGGMSIKLTTPTTRGIPDRMFIFPGGRVIFMEFKSSRGRVSPMQEHIIKKFKYYGLNVHLCDNYEQAIKILVTAPIPAQSD